MSWRLKLSNWLSDGAIDKYKRQAESARARLQQAESDVDSLKVQLKQSQVEVEQAAAQLQIYRGFQVELGETQIKLQQAETELQKYRQELENQQKQLAASKIKLQQTKAKLVNSQDWIQQLQTPIQVVDVKRLPQEDFDALWGFGIGSPVAESEISTGAMVIKGWVLGKKALATKIIVIYQGQVLTETPVDQPRPNVTQYYPDIPAAANSGFESPLAILGLESEAELEVQTVLEDGSVIPLCVICLQRQ